MKKLLALLTAGIMVFSLASCGEKKYEEMTADELIASTIKDKKNITAEEYVKLISTLSNVKINDELELEENITTEAIEKLTDDNDVKLPKESEYIEKLFESNAPQVRGYSVSLITSLFGVNDKNLEAAKKMLKNEKDNYVIYEAVAALGNEGGRDKEIGEFLLNAAKNDNALVRRQVAYRLGSSWNESLEGAVETEIELMNDKDAEVRKAAYSNAGNLNDERVIAPIVEMLNNEAEVDFHSSGIGSLVDMWYNYPFHEKTSEAAYRATMDYLKKFVPGNENIPAWDAVSSFNVKNKDKFAAWRAKATYYNPAEIAEVMTAIIVNPEINWLARTGAVEEMAIHCTKEQYEALGAAVNGLSDDKASFVKNEYEEHLGDFE